MMKYRMVGWQLVSIRVNIIFPGKILQNLKLYFNEPFPQNLLFNSMFVSKLKKIRQLVYKSEMQLKSN